MSKTYVIYRVWDGCKVPMNLEYGGRLIGQIVRESTIDCDTLLELADELEGEGLDGWASGPIHVGEYARRIREACGEVIA